MFLNTAKPLLFVSLAVSHLSETFDLLTRAAVNDFNVTGSGAQGADGITMTRTPPPAGPALIVATKNKSCPPLAAGMLPLTGRDTPIMVNCVVSVMSASAEGDMCPSPSTSAKTRKYPVKVAPERFVSVAVYCRVAQLASPAVALR